MFNITRVTFEIRQNVMNLVLVYDQSDPDIVISVAKQRPKHSYRYICQTKECAFPFDGIGGVLAQGFLPSGESSKEIPLDPSVKWLLGSDSNENIPVNTTRLL